MSAISGEPGRVYTIGHSNQTCERFVGLLRRQGIDLVVDVRSCPRSRHVPQYDREPLSVVLASAGIAYLYLGGDLGGRPNEPACYDANGQVRYDRVAARDRFREGIRRVAALLQARSVVLMCSEEDPTDCHRRTLLGRVLAECGAEVLHLRADGLVQTDAEVALAEHGGQLALFAPENSP